jgi:Tfp pilus assembly protein PilO
MAYRPVPWNERQQLTALAVGLVLLIGAAYYFVMLPVIRNRRVLESEIARMRQTMAAGGALLEELPLESRRNALRQAAVRRRECWEKAARELSTFEKQEILRTTEVGKIDFKVALFEVRERLRRKADEYGIRPTFELAIDEKVLSNEDARKRMLQLRAAERIMDTTLGLKVHRIESVEPLEPVAHQDPETGEVFLEEYPVRIQFVGNIENVYAFFQELFQTNRVFAVRRMRLEKESLNNPDQIRAEATVSALVFLRQIEEVQMPKRPSAFVRPLGF